MASVCTSNQTEATTTEAKSSDCSAEIDAIKRQFIGRCRVITDCGDYKYIVTIQPENMDATIKFQLRELYPSVIPDVAVRSSSLTEGQILELRTEIITKAKKLSGSFMISRLMKLAQEKLTAFGLKPGMTKQVEMDTDIITDNSKARNPKKKGKKKRKFRSEDEVEEEKKKPMKTADDVIKRIQWDESLDSEEFLVGYIDRFRGLLEKYFSAFSWEDLASVDYDVLAVPHHRIQYFKYKTIKVWDKLKRIDNVFGSANGTKTIDVVIKEVEELENGNLNSEEIKEPTESDCSSEDTDEDSDDDDDDIVVTIGASANIGVSKPCVNSSNTNQDEEVEGNEGEDCERVESYNPFWRDKLRPNYFICVRMTDPEILDSTAQIQDCLMDQDPHLGQCCIPGGSLHVTLCTLGLDTPQQLLNCIDVLNKTKDNLSSVLPKSALKLHGVSHFYNRVVYAKVNYKDDFIDFCNELKFNLIEAGIEIRDGYEFVPHMTVMKTTRPASRLRGSKNIDPSLYQPFLEMHLGEQKIDTISLCSMSSERRDDGFYLTPVEIKF